jgi:adenine-specific DNA-methyltransferase
MVTYSYQMANLRTYFGTTEAAKRLQVSRDTLLRWFREGRVIPVSKDGRGWRYFTEDDIRRIAREAGLPTTTSYNPPDVRQSANTVKESLSNWPSSKPLRLIQYLGSKLRSLPEVIPIIQQNTPESGACLDLFAGTSVVGQGLLHHCSVLSNDCLLFSKIFGDVLIGGPDNHRDVPLPDLTLLRESPAYRRNIEHLTHTYEAALMDEERILATNDGPGLGYLATALPHSWNTASAAQTYKRALAFLKESDLVTKQAKRFSEPAFLFTAYYAGNYFGIKQTIEIDSLRLAIEVYRQQGRISEWQAKALIASLLAACSRAVSTAGKHFAQPLILNSDKQRSFALTRALADRKVSITEQMGQALLRIGERSVVPRKPSRSFLVPFEDLIAEAAATSETLAFSRFFGVEGVDTIYADPPYTAQQYSRFYHILETLSLYDYPDLQTHPRTPHTLTQGLYRVDRHKSVFCSKTAATNAFKSLFSIAQQTSDSLILSYSETSITSGNPRMINAATILDIAKRHARSVEEQELNHKYRKLNNESVNHMHGDPEKLYVFRFR